MVSISWELRFGLSDENITECCISMGSPIIASGAEKSVQRRGSAEWSLAESLDELIKCYIKITQMFRLPLSLLSEGISNVFDFGLAGLRFIIGNSLHIFLKLAWVF
jgi:hypothetical protein